MKVGIVVPYSWSFWGAVIEHAELQAQALGKLGIETRTIMGNDPPGSFTRALHPRLGRHGEPPADVIPVGRSVIVPANGSLPNIVLSPSSVPRIRRVLERERFDVLHLHEPMTPAICVATLAFARCPIVGTWHASGPLDWMRVGLPLWGFLMDRIDHRIAVSEPARATIASWIPGEWEIVPNGTLIPDEADPGGRQNRFSKIRNAGSEFRPAWTTSTSGGVPSGTKSARPTGRTRAAASNSRACSGFPRSRTARTRSGPPMASSRAASAAMSTASAASSEWMEAPCSAMASRV